MTYLLAGLMTLVCAWFLASPLRRSVATPTDESGNQEVLRDRLLNQLEALEAEYADRLIEEAAFEDEKRRIEVELAEVLREHPDASPAPRSDSGERSAGVWFASLIIFALALPLVGGGLYFYEQLPTLTRIAQHEKNQAAQSQVQGENPLPPEVAEMVARLEQKLQSDPNNGEGWKMLGRSYAVMGRTDDAIKAYQRAQQLLPDDANVRQALAQLSRQAVSEAATQGEAAQQIQAMVAQLEEKLKDDPDNIEGWVRLGRSYLVLSQPAKAKLAWESAYERAPEDPRVLTGYAETILTLDRNDPEGLAAGLYDQLYAVDPQNINALWFKGVTAYKAAAYLQAAEYWRVALTTLPADHPDTETLKRAISDAQAAADKAENAGAATE